MINQGLGYLLANNFFYKVLNSLVLFVLTIILSRSMGASGYGILSLLIANATLFNLLTSLGIESGITYHIAFRKFPTSRVVYVIIVFLIIQLSILCFIQLALSQFYQKNLFLGWQIPFAWGFAIVFVLSLSIVDKYTAVYNGHRLFRLLNQVVLYSNAGILGIFAIIYFFFTLRSLELYFQIYIVSCFLQALLLVFYYHYNNLLPLKKLQTQAWRSFFNYSLLAFLTNVIQFLAYRIDFWLINRFYNEEHLGWYALSVRIAQLFWMVPILFAGVLLPVIAVNNTIEMKVNLRSLIRILNYCNLFLGTIFFLASDWLIPFVFGPEYKNSIIPLKILLPGVILFSMATILAAYFGGINKLKVNFYGSLFCFVLIFALDLFLIPAYGENGAAIASCIGYGATAFYFLIVFTRLSKLPFLSFFSFTLSDFQSVLKLTNSYFKK